MYLPHERGVLGEELAFCHVKRLGYKVLLRNFRCPLGEIDLIAKHKGVLVFIEVKTRTSEACGFPLESVTREKRQQMRRVAQYYIKRYGIYEAPCRFDVVAVLMRHAESVEIEMVENAFGENEC